VPGSDPADDWARRLATLAWEELPPDARERTLIALFDSLAVAAGGSAAPGVPAMLRGVAEASGSGEVAVPWTGLRLGPAGAAAALSTLIHAWDFDDTHDAATVHTCAVAVPAALAAGAAAGASGHDVLAAIVVGIQTLVRLSLVLGPQPGVVRTAGLGAFGAAAAAARALRLDADRFLAALRLALPSSLAPTSRQVIEDGALNKRFQPAQAVQAGVNAAFLAANGIDGPAGWMVGTYGMGRLAPDLDRALGCLEQPGWDVTNLSLKPYPCCRYAHSAIAGVLTVRRPDTDGAVIHVPKGPAYEFVSRPFARRGQPIVDAQFSIPWLAAAALLRGRVDLETLSGQVLDDTEIEKLAERVVVVQDLEPSKDVMAPAHVKLRTSDGMFTTWVQHAPGSPQAPLSWDDVADKASPCAVVGGYGDEAVPVLLDVVRGLEGIAPGGIGALGDRIGGRVS